MNRYTGYISTALSIAVLVFAVSVLFGTFLDRPVLVSYVLSNSMEPTLSEGDIIFINPFVFNPGKNDVIIFKSGKDYVVHRIMAVTQSGFITKGDNNIATDQLNGKPNVKKEDIAGKIMVIGSWAVAIPHAGEYLKTLSTAIGRNKIGIIAILLILGLYLSTESEERKAKKRIRGRTALRLSFSFIYFLFSISILVIIALSMVMVTEERSIEYATTSGAGKIENWYFPGEVFQKELNIHNYGKYPYIYKLEISSPRLSIEESTPFTLRSGEEKIIAATVHAPVETQLNTERIKIWKYLPLLHADAFEMLFSINPFLPVLVIDMELALILVIVYFMIGGQNEESIRLQTRSLSLDRIKRELYTKLGGIV